MLISEPKLFDWHNLRNISLPMQMRRVDSSLKLIST